MKPLMLAMLFFTLTSTTAFAICEYQSDYIIDDSLTTASWDERLIEEKTYSNKPVKSKIGNFRIKISGGIREMQYIRTYTHVCTSGSSSQFSYSEEVEERGSRREAATKVTVMFPNSYEIEVFHHELSPKHIITMKGIKEIGPFSPVNELPDAQAILVVGKHKLSAEDYKKLQAAF
jgi:hypothetical protein